MRRSIVTNALCSAVLFATIAACTDEVNPDAPSLRDAESITSINAEFADEEGTKTYITMNGAGTYATVSWNNDDQIKIANYTSAGAHSTGANNEAVFKHSSSNAETGSAEFAAVSNAIAAKDAYLAFYPAASASSFGASERSVTYTVPATQTAMADGITTGYNFAAAFADHGTDLMFYNLLTPVRFTLDGSSARNINKVVLTYNSGSGNIAGTATTTFTASKGAPGAPSISSGSLAITLNITGTSSSRGGRAYYFMTLPGTSSGFKLEFYDGNSLIKTLTSANTTARKRGQILDLGTVLVNGDDLPTLPNGATVTRYHKQTRGNKPNVLVITGDGWTSDQQGSFMNHARESVDYIFGTEPFKTYKDFFTVYIMPTTSIQAGKGNTDGYDNFTEDVNNYFGSSWSAAGQSEDMDLNWDGQGRFDGSSHASLKSFVETYCPEIASGSLTINDVPIGILVNDASWAGYSHWYWSGAVYCMTSYYNGNVGEFAFGQNGWMVKDDADGATVDNMVSDESCRNSIGRHSSKYFTATMLHELMGHGFGRFYDEYWYGYPGIDIDDCDYPYGDISDQYHDFALNLSSDYSDVPWQEFLDRRNALMAVNPDYGRLGKYQGGMTWMFGIWRSEIVSCMIDHRQYFSTWQRWLLYNRIMEKCGMTPTLEEFFENDVTTDPVREVFGDGTRSGVSSSGTVFTHMHGGCVKMHQGR